MIRTGTIEDAICPKCGGARYDIKNMKRAALKRKTRLKPMSRKMASQMKLYRGLRAEMLQEYPFCEFPGCLNRASEPHHMKGRGKYLNNTAFWMMVCPEHHRWIEDNKREARKRGFILYQ